MGLREQKRERIRETIVQVAFRLFAERGYDETMVEEIAAASEVSTRTFYRYFDSKDTILAESGFAVVDEAADVAGPDASIVALAEAMADALTSRIDHEHMETTMRLMREHPRIADRAPCWHGLWASHLELRLAAQAGRSRPTLDDRVRSTVAVHVVAVASEEWLYRRPDATVLELVRESLQDLEAALHEPGEDADRTA